MFGQPWGKRDGHIIMATEHEYAKIYLDQIIYRIAIVATWKQKLKCYYSLLWQINMQVSIYFPFFQKIYSVIKHIITFFLHYSAIVILYLIYLLFIAMTIYTKFNNKLSSLCFFSGIIIIISCISWLLLKTTLLEGMLKNDLLQVFNIPHTSPSGWSRARNWTGSQTVLLGLRTMGLRGRGLRDHNSGLGYGQHHSPATWTPAVEPKSCPASALPTASLDRVRDPRIVPVASPAPLDPWSVSTPARTVFTQGRAQG